VILREATADDVAALVDVQEPGAVLGLGHIFPQDRYPFPREVIADRWRREIAAEATEVYVYTDDTGVVCGFAATRDDELLHFGTAASTWGSGLATSFHDALLERIAGTAGRSRVRLRVFTDNRRARRFYEKNGWRPTGVRSRTTFPPHPELLEYTRDLPPLGQLGPLSSR
jgi:RimJ/RimL family protein N-acetyltransferase